MVALFFTAFPEEAEKYREEVEHYEWEEEQRRKQNYVALRSYVKSLSKRDCRSSCLKPFQNWRKWDADLIGDSAEKYVSR